MSKIFVVSNMIFPHTLSHLSMILETLIKNLKNLSENRVSYDIYYSTGCLFKKLAREWELSSEV